MPVRVTVLGSGDAFGGGASSLVAMRRFGELLVPGSSQDQRTLDESIRYHLDHATLARALPRT